MHKSLGVAFLAVAVFGCSSSSTSSPSCTSGTPCLPGDGGGGASSGQTSSSGSAGGAAEEAFAASCTGTFKCTEGTTSTTATAALQGSQCTFSATLMGIPATLDLEPSGALELDGTMAGTWTVSAGVVTFDANVLGQTLTGTCTPSSS
jgi:hypothetical protein